MCSSDQPGTGHGPSRSGNERPGGVFAAEQAQDVIDKRGHLHFPSIEEAVRRRDRRCAIDAMDSASPRNRGLIRKPAKHLSGSAWPPR